MKIPVIIITCPKLLARLEALDNERMPSSPVIRIADPDLIAELEALLDPESSAARQGEGATNIPKNIPNRAGARK